MPKRYFFGIECRERRLVLDSHFLRNVATWLGARHSSYSLYNHEKSGDPNNVPRDVHADRAHHCAPPIDADSNLVFPLFHGVCRGVAGVSRRRGAELRRSWKRQWAQLGGSPRQQPAHQLGRQGSAPTVQSKALRCLLPGAGETRACSPLSPLGGTIATNGRERSAVMAPPGMGTPSLQIEPASG